MSTEKAEWLAEHFDSEILEPEDLQAVLDFLIDGKADEALKLLTTCRDRAWSDEEDKRIKQADDYIDYMVDQYGIERFGSERAGHLAWHAEKARRAA